MSRNEFDCLTNALLQAGLICRLPVAFAVPVRVREILQATDVEEVVAVMLHQCPQAHGLVDYKLEVMLQRESPRHEHFQASGFGFEHETYVLYDYRRDGRMKHLHLLH